MATQQSKRLEKIGATFGLAATTCDMDDHRAEQVYVNLVDSDSHPIEVDAWVGYSTTGKMKLTKRQASELIGLLAQALAQV
jgi:hypothetical protein